MLSLQKMVFVTKASDKFKQHRQAGALLHIKASRTFHFVSSLPLSTSSFTAPDHRRTPTMAASRSCVRTSSCNLHQDNNHQHLLSEPQPTATPRALVGMHQPSQQLLVIFLSSSNFPNSLFLEVTQRSLWGWGFCSHVMSAGDARQGQECPDDTSNDVRTPPQNSALSHQPCPPPALPNTFSKTTQCCRRYKWP